MSGLRGRSAVAADHRSALPRVPGIPWWGAAIAAATLTAIGVAFDAGSGASALGGVFATCYVVGCLAAVLAVRQSGIFTAVIQPPLILFVAVPFAYFVFHGSTFTGIKDLLINCGYPLIERFPLMFFTSAIVLVIGMVRWYMGAAARRGVPEEAEPVVADPQEVPAPRKRRSTRGAEARATRAAAVDDAMEDEEPRTSRRTARAGTAASRKPTGAAAGPSSRRSRHSRPPETETIEPVQDRPRRRNTPPVDASDEPRRRSRASESRSREPRERRPLPPLDRRGVDRDRPERERYERPSERESYERPSERSERPQRRERPDGYERPERLDRPERRRPRSADYEPYEPPPVSRNGSGGGGTHHPVSRVRYRGSDDDDSRTEHRTKPRPPRHQAPDSWEYDA